MTGHGSGFALLPLRVSVLGGDLAKWGDAQLSLLVALAAHVDENGTAWPSQRRLATLSGLSKTTVGSAVGELSKAGWVIVSEGTRGRRYRMTLGKGSECVAIRQAVVFTGLWAACTPSARKLLVLLLARSRPGDGREGAHISDWEAAVENGRGEDGCRHVLPEHIEPSELACLIGASDRTYREAMARLLTLGLVCEYEDNDNLVIPNDPGYHIPGILAALNRFEDVKSSRSAKCAATWRRKRRPLSAESVPLGRTGGSPPGVDPALPHVSLELEEL